MNSLFHTFIVRPRAYPLIFWQEKTPAFTGETEIEWTKFKEELSLSLLCGVCERR